MSRRSARPCRAPRTTNPRPTIPRTKLFYVWTNLHGLPGFGVKYKGGFPYVAAILSMYPVDHGDTHGRLIAYDLISGQTSWWLANTWQVYSGR